MAAGKISIQANDGKVAGVVFEDGASSNVTVTIPKEGGTLATQTGLSTKQDTLVSGTSIKTINSTSLLGSGNISITDTAWASNDSRAKTALNASGSAPIYACRAWVNFNGTETGAIRASGNVSSIVDRGVGLYSVNLTTALPDINGSAHTGTALDTNTSIANGVSTGPVRIVSTTVINIGTGNTGGPADQTDIYCSVFR